MKDDARIQKSLAKITSDEKGWRKALASADGSFSKNLAEENLSRLAVSRQALLKQANTIQLHRKNVMQIALADGMITDHISDGICEELVQEGWLERAGQLPVRPHVNRALAYLPTDKAVQEWQNEATSAAPGKA